MPSRSASSFVRGMGFYPPVAGSSSNFIQIDFLLQVRVIVTSTSGKLIRFLCCLLLVLLKVSYSGVLSESFKLRANSLLDFTWSICWGLRFPILYGLDTFRQRFNTQCTGATVQTVPALATTGFRLEECQGVSFVYPIFTPRLGHARNSQAPTCKRFPKRVTPQPE